MEDPREIRSCAIEKTLAGFDFAKVAAATAAAGWNIGTRPPGAEDAPLMEEMRVIARGLLERAWDDENAPNCEYCHGGLRAWRSGGCLTLQFVIEESFFIVELDAGE